MRPQDRGRFSVLRSEDAGPSSVVCFVGHPRDDCRSMEFSKNMAGAVFGLDFYVA